MKTNEMIEVNEPLRQIVRKEIIELARHGFTASEIAKILELPMETIFQLAPTLNG